MSVVSSPGLNKSHHYRSEGVPGYISSWNAIADDVEQYVREVVDAKWSGVPLFVMGESMGGA